MSDKEAASKSSQALREKSKKGAMKKCGKCSEDKTYWSYTKEQWRVTEDDERECKVCENHTASLEQGKALNDIEAAIMATDAAELDTYTKLPPDTKKCGKCSEDKTYGSYTKEQWRVTEDDERECKVCEKYTALLEQGKAQKPLEESHLMYCQFINGDGHYGKNANKNCSDVDDGWRIREKFMQMNRDQSFCCDEGSVDDDDDSLQYLAGGALYDEDPSIPPPPPAAVEQPPPPAVEQPPANPPRVLTPFVELSPGVNGAVDNATILSGKTFVLTGQFPEVPFGPEPQGVQGEQDYRSPDHRIIKNTIESFGGQVSESIPPCDCK